MLEYNIKVKINDIEVDSKYYSFSYEASCNGKTIYAEYNSDHSWDDLGAFRELLEGGYALQLVLEAGKIEV